MLIMKSIKAQYQLRTKESPEHSQQPQAKRTLVKRFKENSYYI